MLADNDCSPAPPDTGYSDAVKTAVQETTLRVREMHAAIAGTCFDILQRVPLISPPARLVRSVHDGIAAAVYGAIHRGSGALLAGAATVEQQASGQIPARPPGRLACGLRGVLNGAFGDHLAAHNNRLAVRMALYANSAALVVDRDSLRSVFPDASRRVCVLIHGLGCNEHSWEVDDPEKDTDFGRQLAADFACTALHLRYNSGLPIAANGAQLAGLLGKLLAAWPRTPSELLLIGHSMGGLVALAACQHAAEQAMDWPQTTRMLICLGSPNLGSPVERLGQLTNAALRLSRFSAPLGTIAGARSQGVKDLRQGPGAARSAPAHAQIAYRFLGACLSRDSAHPFAKGLGDGLVTPASATAHGIAGDVQTATLTGLGHMRLLKDPRVYRQIRDWVAAIDERAAG